MNGCSAGVYPFFIEALGGLDPNLGYVPAFQYAQATVHPMGEHPPIVIADGYPKLQSVGWDVDLLDNGSYSPDGDDLVKFEWDFNGDGIYDAVGKEVKHYFDTPGDYPVGVRVTDSDGYTGTQFSPIWVHIKPGFGWARTWGSEYEDGSHTVAVDSLGGIYVAGFCTGDIDLDPGPKDDHFIGSGRLGIFFMQI